MDEEDLSDEKKVWFWVASIIIKVSIFAGLGILHIGLIANSFSPPMDIMFDKGNMVMTLSKIAIQIGVMLVSLGLVSYSLLFTKKDVTLRFGCMLVAGLLTAFEMMAML